MLDDFCPMNGGIQHEITSPVASLDQPNFRTGTVWQAVLFSRQNGGAYLLQAIYSNGFQCGDLN